MTTSPRTYAQASRSRLWTVREDQQQHVGMSQTAKGKGKLREPPPTLFLHPSPAASHASLPGILAPGAPAPPPSNAVPLNQQSAGHQRMGSLHASSVVSPSVTRPIRTLKTADSSRSADRTDALWAEMQATLEEVELSASGGTHVFGPDHDRKLAELRAAQIALAQAWARSEADDAIETNKDIMSITGDEVRNLKGTVLGDSTKPTDGTDAAKSTAGTNSAARPGSSGVGTERLGAKLEEETEVDILLARKRREANDRYFHCVNQGVLDVVAKLEDVAIAMRTVEQESKGMWGEEETPPGSAKP
jgi:hypothetical protein